MNMGVIQAKVSGMDKNELEMFIALNDFSKEQKNTIWNHWKTCQCLRGKK